MNRKEAIVVALTLFGTLITGVYADTVSTTSTSRGTLHTASDDIGILNIVPGVGSGSTTLFGVTIHNFPPSDQFNFTSGFSFNPHSTFIQVSSVILTVVYSFAGGGPGSINVRFNGQNSGQVTFGAQLAVTTAGNISTQGLRVGSNLVELSTSVGTGVQAYQVRLTVEYTFLA